MMRYIYIRKSIDYFVESSGCNPFQEAIAGAVKAPS
ncbi:hypothetical protein PFWH6_4325 [Pseudomonas fluorescens WH6]|nr:hypothetical protein PFWH6_4325 [Pseudomonas fluorescens WH6]